MREAARVDRTVWTFAGHAGRRDPEPPSVAGGLPLWPPRVRGAGWRYRSARGTVHATTTVGPAGEAQCKLALVDLDSGGRVTSRVLGGGTGGGARVALVWDGHVPVFAAEPPTDRSGLR